MITVVRMRTRILARCGLVLGLMAGSVPAAERWQVVAPAPGPLLVRLWPASDQRSVTATVPVRVVSAQPGEAMEVLVDAPASGRIVLTTDERPAQDGPWTARGGVLVEARSIPAGSMATADELRSLWSRGSLQGRTVVDRIFLGTNPCGPYQACALRCEGWLRIPRSGRWRLATVSRDASLVEVDGSQAVAWPGRHGVDGGMRGEHGQDLSLEVGDHRIVYLVAADRLPPIAELAWQGPGMSSLEVVPAAAWRAAPLVTAQPVDGVPWLSWEITGHHQAEGAAVMEVRVEAHGGSATTAWRWDDGVEDRGPVAIRPLVRVGLHTVTATLGGITIRRSIAVHPSWTWTGTWNGDELARRLAALVRHAPASEDLAAALDLLRAEDHQALMPWRQSVVEAAIARLPGDGALREALFALALDVADGNAADARRCETIARALAGAGPAGDPQASRAGLLRAGILIRSLDRPDEGAAALEALRPAVLTKDEQRRATILRGDAAAGRGDLVAARAAYATAGGISPAADRGAAIRRRVRLERARDLLAMSKPEEAAELVRGVLWDRPEERLDAGVAALVARVALAREDALAAVAALRPAIQAAPLDDRRAEALALLVQAASSCGRPADAAAAQAVLRRDHPFSEAAGRK